MTVAQYPRLANPSDIPRLISGDRTHNVWPPTGTTVTRYGFPETWVLVTGTPTVGSPGDWWLTTLGEVATDVDATVEQLLVRFGQVFTGPVAALAGTAANWPVIYEQGKANFMRWISSTFRGTLGGVEQFQFGINWGNPGADPDPNEGETLAFAASLRAKFETALSNVQSTTLSAKSLMSSEVKFTEVGAVVKTQTDPTGADGKGGNLEQKFDTQWDGWTVPGYAGTAAGGASLPYEVALAVTLQTDTRGPRGRGRLYFPPLNTNNMSGSGKFSLSAIQTVGECFGDFFQAVTAAHSYVPVVVSRRAIQLHEVTTVQVGYVPDSQRRRRRSQDEARVIAWTAP